MVCCRRRPAANKVDIWADGGARRPVFLFSNMDQRLEPFLEQNEYTDVLTKANAVLTRRAPGLSWRLVALCTPIIAAGLPTIHFGARQRPTPQYICDAANGWCFDGQDPAADACCQVMCCGSLEP